MIDVLGSKIKKGSIVLVHTSAGIGYGLTPGIVLNIFEDNGVERIKVARATKRSMTKEWFMIRVSNYRSSNRICTMDYIPHDLREVLNEAYRVYWEPR